MIYFIVSLFSILSILLIINFIIEHRNIQQRKKNNILEVRVNIYVSLVFIAIGFLFGLFFILAYFLKLFDEFNLQKLILSLLVTMICYCVSLFLINNKVYINNKIVKKIMFFKKEWNIEDVTLIKHHSNVFVFNLVSYYIKNKRIFTISYKHQDFPNEFEDRIKELSKCKVDLLK